MVIVRVIAGVWLFTSVFGVVDRIQKAMEKGDFEKVMELIEKGYEKEPENPGIFYYHASLLFEPSYSGFHADSARLLINQANSNYDNADEEVLKELDEAGLSKGSLTLLAEAIRDYHLGQVLAALSLEEIAGFRSKYPGSIYEEDLIIKRDSILFEGVLKQNTIAQFEEFIRKHSSSIFVPQADSLLDRRRYEALLKDGELSDYLSFRKTYPNTQWMEGVEEYILFTSTASHEHATFEDFIKQAKTPSLKRKAADVYFYLNNSSQTMHPEKDSLVQMEGLSSIELFPTMDRGKYGFNSLGGDNVLPYRYSKIQEDIKCEVDRDDWLFVYEEDRGKIILKNGQTLIDGATDYVSVSQALALVTVNESRYLYHKSGFKVIEEPIQDAEVFSNGWIKAKKNNKWGLYSMLGFPITDARFQDIYRLSSFWVFEKEGLLGVYTTQEMLEGVQGNGIFPEFKFDDLELVNEALLIGFREERECLLDGELNFLIPWGEYEIYPDQSGWYLRSSEGYYLYNNTDERVIDRKYPYLESNEGWLALQTEEDWILIARQGSLEPSRGYDSIKLINDYVALTFTGEKKTIVFASGKRITLKEHEVRSFTSQPEFLLIRNNGALGLYNRSGEAVFDGKYDNLTFVNDSLLKVYVKGKQGIIDTSGNFLLNPIFDTLDEKDGLILTLYKGTIGCYDLQVNVLIAPEYERRISRIGSHYLVYQEGKYGLIDANKEEVLGFSFDEIKYWNDTSYLVTAEEKVNIINASEEILIRNIESLEPIYEGEESIYQILENGKFGLISNLEGVILKSDYTEIFNIGSKKDPLFFADQHLHNAGFHVVSYIDRKGSLVFSKAYRSEEFDRIICDD